MSSGVLLSSLRCCGAISPPEDTVVLFKQNKGWVTKLSVCLACYDKWGDRYDDPDSGWFDSLEELV